MHLPAEGWAGAFLEATAKCQAVVIGPGARHGRQRAEEIRAVIAGCPVPLVIDADALRRAGRRRRRRGPCSTSAARRASSRRTTASTPASPDRHRARSASRRPAGSPPAPERWSCSRVRSTAVATPDGDAVPDVLLAAAGVPASPRPAAATCSRASSAPSAPGASTRCDRGRAGRARTRSRRGARPVRGPGLRRPAGPGGPVPVLLEPSPDRAAWMVPMAEAPVRLVPPVPEDEDAAVTMAQGRSRPGVGGDRPGRGGAQRRRPGAPRRARPSCARWSRPTATGTAVRRWPAPRWPAARSSWRSRWSTRASSCASTASPPPCCCSASADPTACRDGARLRAHADALLGRRHRRLRRRGAGGGPSGRRARQGRHRHAPRRRRARGPRRHRGGGRRASRRSARGRLDPPARGRRRAGRGPRLHRGPARPLRAPRRPTSAPPASTRRCCTPPTRPAAVAFPRAALRDGALRPRSLRLPAGRRGPGAPSPHRRAATTLRPAMSLKAQVVAVRTLEAGERPSYGRLRPLPTRSLRGHRPHRLRRRRAPRLFDGGYEVLIGGRRRPLAGMVTMDQIVVDCGADDSVRPGDEVVLLGTPGRRDDHGGRLGGPARHDQLRGGVRRRPAHAPHPREPPRRARCLTPPSSSSCASPRRPAPVARLAEGRTQVVFGVGNPAADLLFVGEGPGREEDLAGEPFVGRSGQAARPPHVGGDRPDPGRVLHRQRRQVPAAQQPRPGTQRDRGLPAVPGRADRADRPGGDRHPGQLLHQAPPREHAGHPRAARPGLRAGERQLVPTYHPAYVLRAGGEAMAEMRADLVRAKRLVSGGPGVSWPSNARPRRADATRALAARLARPVPRRRRRAAGRRPRRRQDGLRPGLRRRARGGGPGDEPHLRARAPLPLRAGQPVRALSTPTCTAPTRWPRWPTWPWPSWSRRTRWPSSSGATRPRPARRQRARGHARRSRPARRRPTTAPSRSGPRPWGDRADEVAAALAPRSEPCCRERGAVRDGAAASPGDARGVVAIETATETVGVAVRTPDGVRGRIALTRSPAPRRDAHPRAGAPPRPRSTWSRPTSASWLSTSGRACSPACGSGVAAAKALAQSLGIGVVGATSLDILTEARPRRGQGPVLACVDARRGEVFASAASSSAPGRRRPSSSRPACSPRPDWSRPLGGARRRGGVAVGDGALRYAEALQAVPGLDDRRPACRSRRRRRFSAWPGRGSRKEYRQSSPCPSFPVHARGGRKEQFRTGGSVLRRAVMTLRIEKFRRRTSALCCGSRPRSFPSRGRWRSSTPSSPCARAGSTGRPGTATRWRVTSGS